MNYLMAKEVGVFRYVWKRLIWRLIRFMPGTDCALRLPNGMMFKAPKESSCAADVFVTGGALDWGTEWILVEYLKRRPGCVLVDVGANVGFYSTFLSPYYRKGYAFDPDSRNQHPLWMLKARLPELDVLDLAVCDHDGMVPFSPGIESSVSSLGGEGAADTVRCVTLDSYFDGRPDEVAVIKIDIEGYDVLALRGSFRLIAKHRPVVALEVEVEDGKPNSPEAVVEVAERLCMDVYAVVRTDPSWWRCRYDLVKFQPGDWGARWVKMVILAPREDERFCEVIRSLPASWDGGLVRGVKPFRYEVP